MNFKGIYKKLALALVSMSLFTASVNAVVTYNLKDEKGAVLGTITAESTDTIQVIFGKIPASVDKTYKVLASKADATEAFPTESGFSVEDGKTYDIFLVPAAQIVTELPFKIKVGDKECVVRLKSNQTLEDLHNAIIAEGAVAKDYSIVFTGIKYSLNKSKKLSELTTLNDAAIMITKYLEFPLAVKFGTDRRTVQVKQTTTIAEVRALPKVKELNYSDKNRFFEPNDKTAIADENVTLKSLNIDKGGSTLTIHAPAKFNVVFQGYEPDSTDKTKRSTTATKKGTFEVTESTPVNDVLAEAVNRFGDDTTLVNASMKGKTIGEVFDQITGDVAIQVNVGKLEDNTPKTFKVTLTGYKPNTGKTDYEEDAALKFEFEKATVNTTIGELSNAVAAKAAGAKVEIIVIGKDTASTVQALNTSTKLSDLGVTGDKGVKLNYRVGELVESKDKDKVTIQGLAVKVAKNAPCADVIAAAKLQYPNEDIELLFADDAKVTTDGLADGKSYKIKHTPKPAPTLDQLITAQLGSITTDLATAAAEAAKKPAQGAKPADLANFYYKTFELFANQAAKLHALREIVSTATDTELPADKKKTHLAAINEKHTIATKGGTAEAAKWNADNDVQSSVRTLVGNRPALTTTTLPSDKFEKMQAALKEMYINETVYVGVKDADVPANVKTSRQTIGADTDTQKMAVSAMATASHLMYWLLATTAVVGGTATFLTVTNAKYKFLAPYIKSLYLDANSEKGTIALEEALQPIFDLEQEKIQLEKDVRDNVLSQADKEVKLAEIAKKQDAAFFKFAPEARPELIKQAQSKLNELMKYSSRFAFDDFMTNETNVVATQNVAAPAA